MMKRRYLIPATLIFGALLSVTAAADTVEGSSESPLQGLEEVEKNRRGSVYADPDIDWSVYSRIQLEPATVAFRKNWQRDQNRYQHNKIKTSDMDRIKNRLAELFDEVFSAELTQKGDYQLSAEAGEDVLRIEPHIVDLDLYAPDSRSVAGMQRSYAETAGRMTLKLYLHDSITGDMIASLSDSREAPRRGYLQWTTSVTNTAEARHMLQRWARELRERLDEATATGSF